MKRIHSFIFLVLCAIVTSTVYAQQSIYIWRNNGTLSEISNNSVDSLTFSVSDWLFNIQTSDVTSVTENTLQGSVSASFACEVNYLSHNPKVGVCFSSVNETPTCADEYLQIGDTVGTFKFTIYELDPGTTCYYRGYVKLGDEIMYGDVKSCNTSGEKPITPNYTIVNGHKFVDLGLPSGLLWARTNVGAVFSFNDGEYVAWGETEEPEFGYYDWDVYKWGRKLSKYNSADGKTILEPEDDAATIQWGAGCRMPSSSEMQELCDKCKWSWQENYQGTNGYIVTGPNGNTIFLPASGSCDGERLNRGRGWYWSRSLSTDVYKAHSLEFDDFYVAAKPEEYRCIGMSIRPVAEKK